LEVRRIIELAKHTHHHPKQPECNMTSNQARRPFTPEEDRRLEELRNKGLATSDIASEMGRSRNSIESRLSKIGLTNSQEPRARWTQEEDAILDQHSATMPLEDIARILGRSPCAIKKRVFRLREKRTKSKLLLPRAAAKRDSRPHGWNIRPQDRTTYQRKAAAITAVEQAMNRFIRSKDQHNVHIS